MVQETVTLEARHRLGRAAARHGQDRRGGGSFEIEEFRVGRTNEEPSYARLAVRAEDPARLDRVLEALSYLGASAQLRDASRRPRRTGSCLSSLESTTSTQPARTRRARCRARD